MEAIEALAPSITTCPPPGKASLSIFIFFPFFQQAMVSRPAVPLSKLSAETKQAIRPHLCTCLPIILFPLMQLRPKEIRHKLPSPFCRIFYSNHIKSFNDSIVFLGSARAGVEAKSCLWIFLPSSIRQMVIHPSVLGAMKSFQGLSPT